MKVKLLVWELNLNGLQTRDELFSRTWYLALFMLMYFITGFQHMVMVFIYSTKCMFTICFINHFFTLTVSLICTWLILIRHNLCLKSLLYWNMSVSWTSLVLGVFSNTRALPSDRDWRVRFSWSFSTQSKRKLVSCSWNKTKLTVIACYY